MSDLRGINPFQKYLFLYLFGCTWSQLQHSGSLVSVEACRIFQLQHSNDALWPVRSSSLTRDLTWVPCTGSADSQTLDLQRISWNKSILKIISKGSNVYPKTQKWWNLVSVAPQWERYLRKKTINKNQKSKLLIKQEKWTKKIMK